MIATPDDDDDEVIIAELVEDEPEEERLPSLANKLRIVHSIAIFLGKASRGCDNCGTIKLYREFEGSKDPKVLCKYCAWENSELAMLSAMTEKEREEIAEMEDIILENEMEYEEALERQEMIDQVLSQLDE